MTSLFFFQTFPSPMSCKYPGLFRVSWVCAYIFFILFFILWFIILSYSSSILFVLWSYSTSNPNYSASISFNFAILLFSSFCSFNLIHSYFSIYSVIAFILCAIGLYFYTFLTDDPDPRTVVIYSHLLASFFDIKTSAYPHLLALAVRPTLWT